MAQAMRKSMGPVKRKRSVIHLSSSRPECLRIERTEEAFDAAHRSVWVKDA